MFEMLLIVYETELLLLRLLCRRTRLEQKAN